MIRLRIAFARWLPLTWGDPSFRVLVDEVEAEQAACEAESGL